MPDKKFAVLTDSACDMPFELEKSSGVDILGFGITVDGTAYTERADFDFDQYYDILRNCEGVPSTAHITVPRFGAKFEEYNDDGIEELLYVSINANGSATNDAAHMAKKHFHTAHPESLMNITIVDSRTYSMGYGWFVAEAARRLGEGERMADVAAWLEDTFARVEIILAAFSLKFIKKSGRISAAAAFAGELLGLRPVISLIDGASVVQKKVRGDKEVLPTLRQYAEEHRAGDGLYMVGGTSEDTMAELADYCTKAWGRPPVCTFKLGAAVSTNTGPDAIAIVYMGPERPPV